MQITSPILYLSSFEMHVPVPILSRYSVAQCTPCGGMVTIVQGLRRDGRSMLMSLLAGMDAVSGRPWPSEVSEGTGRARLCAYVKHSTLNFAREQALCDRRRANATSSA